MALNESQQGSVLSCLRDVHRRLADMEAMLAQSASPFADIVNDLSPTEARVVRDYFARIRTTMLACLQEAAISLEVRRSGLRWALHCGTLFVSNTVAELSPSRLRGYGTLDAEGSATALKIQQDLNRLIDRVLVYLRQGTGQDLSQRLARLEAAPAGVATLRLLDRILARWQLVEFRPTLEALVGRLEAPQLEIAVFGRVSSGKSSLLNHVAGMDVLSVGVTPITAVPTRLVRGEVPAALVSFAEMAPRRIDLSELGAYASEEGNPGNHKHVVSIVVQLPAPRLWEGVVLVDTPGLGSLALAGSAETLAYLPRCDLGVVLIDAASTLTEEDLGLLRALYEAGIPAQVLLSKADLLTPADRQRLAGYIGAQLREQLGLELPVHPVSVMGADEALLTRWFDQEIAPLLDRHRALTEASLRRKAAVLRESVVAVLKTLLAKAQGTQADGRAGVDVPAARRLLDEAAAAVRQIKARCLSWPEDDPALVEIILQDAARAATAAPDNRPADPFVSAAQQVLAERGRIAQGLVQGFQQTLARTLELLHQAAPLARADVAALRDLALGGVPVLDLAPLQGKCPCRRPWWASLWPRAAVWATRGSLHRKAGAALRDFVDLYDRQLRAWMGGCVGQLIDLYESQAEVFREQLRRLTRDAAGAAAPGEVRDLLADLRELEQSEAAEQETAAGPLTQPQEAAL
jgi:GTP-binding protein EngB required for normal cell division